MMPNDARQIQNGLASINRMLNRLKYRFVSASDAQGPDFVRLRGNVNVAGGFPNGIHGLGERHGLNPGNSSSRHEPEKKKTSFRDMPEHEKNKVQLNREEHFHQSAGSGVLDSSRYTASILSDKDLNTIVGMYGNSVENIYELGPGQRWMLEAGQRVKSAFFLQIEIRAVIELNPAIFRQQVDKVCEKHESLRSAFVYRGVSQPYRVVLKDRHPEVNYFDFSDLEEDEFDDKVHRYMEADRFRGFDLENDSLLRINVYKSGKKNTYSMVVSQPHINTDGTSVGVLFKDLFVGYALDLNGFDKKIESQSYKAYAEHLQNIDTKKELEFWKQYLGGAAEDQLLPGQIKSDLDYDSASYFVPFTQEEQVILLAAQKKLKVTQFVLLQCLWGIMASRLKGRTSIVFGSITAGRDAEVSESLMQTGGFVNVLPIEISFEEEELFSELVSRTQKDSVNVMMNSHCTLSEIKEALGREQPVFGHLMNYRGMARKKPGSAPAAPGIPGVQIIGGDMYDNLSEDLCLYFTVKNDQFGCEYFYNERIFSREVIALLADFFQSMLDALEDVTSQTKISELPFPDADLIYFSQDVKKIKQVKAAGFMKKHPVFESVSEEALLSLAEACSLDHVQENSIIVNPSVYTENVTVLVQGRAVLYGESDGGWRNPVRILKPGSFLNIGVLTGETRPRNLVMNDMEEVMVLRIPYKTFQEFLYDHPSVSLRLVSQIEREKQDYMRLWVKAL
jgi:hypothetical protein